MSVTRKRWWLLALACVINLFAGSIYAWSVFAAGLAGHLTEAGGAAVTAGTLAGAFSLANGVGPVPMILGGWVNDRFGPRALIAAGGLLMGLGYFLCGLADSVLAVTLSYGILFGVGLGLVYGCTINNTMKFFPDHRGLVGGLTTGVYGAGSVVLPPVAAAMISAFGITATLKILGVVIAAVIFVGGILSMRCPDGFQPEGWTAPAAETRPKANVDWRGMLASRTFLPMALLLMCGAVSGMMVLSQCFSIASEQMGMAAASAAVALTALCNTAGRLVAGAASDFLGRTRTLGCALAAGCAGLACLTAAIGGSLVLFYLGLALLGAAFGSFMAVFPGFTAQEFGSRHNSVNYAIMFCGFSIAGVLGPTLMNLLKPMGFAACYGAAAAISLAGFACIALYRRRAR